MDLDFHSGTRKPVMPKKKVFVTRNLEDYPFYHSEQEKQKRKSKFQIVLPRSVAPFILQVRCAQCSKKLHSLKTQIQKRRYSAHPPLSKARFELAPSEEERHLKPPPWTARPSRLCIGLLRYTTLPLSINKDDFCVVMERRETALFRWILSSKLYFPELPAMLNGNNTLEKLFRMK
jgi:hypothetical protein